MIHPYELGLLSDDDREAFELHLYGCQSCFDQVQSLREEMRLINSDDDVKNVVLDATAATVAEPDTDRGRRWILWGPAFVVAAFVFVLLVLKPWHIEFSTDKTVIASENRLIILPFDNLTDEADTAGLGEIVSSLLITDLSASEYLQIVSRQRVADIMAGRELDKLGRMPAGMAGRIAGEANARWLLTGQILVGASGMTISSQLIDVATGDIIASQHVSDSGGGDMFGLVDALTVQIKRSLALPEAAQWEADPAIADMTTHSPEAYRHYLEGVRLYGMFYIVDAIKSFHRAIEVDSTFAAAYYYLAKLESRAYVDKAVEYSSQASAKERLYIQSLRAIADGQVDEGIAYLDSIIRRYPDEKYAYYSRGNYFYQLGMNERAAEDFRASISIDPHFNLAYNMLVYCYDRLGDFENALLTINRYIAMAPDEANPYDTRADLYANHGMIDKAIESYRTALRIKPGFVGSLRKMGHVYLFGRDYQRADSCYLAIVANNDSSFRHQICYYRSLIQVSQGRFMNALEMLDNCRQGFEQDGRGDEAGYVYRQQAIIYRHLGRTAEAVAYIDTCMQYYKRLAPTAIVNNRYFYAQFLAEDGQLDRARDVARQLKSDLEAAGGELSSYWYAMGSIAMAEGDAIAAIEYFRQAIEDDTDFAGNYLLGQAYLAAGNLADAVDIFEKQMVVYNGGWHLSLLEWMISIHYYLGQAYERSGWNDRAAEQYRLFLEHWGQSDVPLKEVEDARQRLARLQTS